MYFQGLTRGMSCLKVEGLLLDEKHKIRRLDSRSVLTLIQTEAGRRALKPTSLSTRFQKVQSTSNAYSQIQSLSLRNIEGSTLLNTAFNGFLLSWISDAGYCIQRLPLVPSNIITTLRELNNNKTSTMLTLMAKETQ
jgi:hypothetical protein